MTKDIVDIIVITFNRIEYFKTFIEMLYLSTKYPFRLIVVDNGSIDGTREWVVEKEKEGVIWKHVFNSENMKMAAAFSEGFKHVESELFLTTQDDITPPILQGVDWLEVFVAKIKSDESIGCINFVASRQNFNEFNKKNRPRL